MIELSLSFVARNLLVVKEYHYMFKMENFVFQFFFNVSAICFYKILLLICILLADLIVDENFHFLQEYQTNLLALYLYTGNYNSYLRYPKEYTITLIMFSFG